jgi:NUMOD4 motif
MTAETWLPVCGWGGYYEVSNHGRVRSVDRLIIRRDGRKYRAKGRILRPATHKPSWVRSVTLARAGYRSNQCVHLLVRAAFGIEEAA